MAGQGHGMGMALGHSIGHPGGGDARGVTVLELEPWPRRRVLYHMAEWLEWLGCEDVLIKDHSAFPVWTSTL